MSAIKVDLDKFEVVSKKFSSAADKCTSLQKQLESSTNMLLNEWEGESKDAFQHEYDILKQNMCNYSEMLKYISQEIMDIRESYKRADESLMLKMYEMPDPNSIS